MPAIYFIITIFVGIVLYLVLSMIREQEQDKQKYD
jgi:phage shock protein PspC (stress-responsive transcriptional regulator)